MKAAVLGEVLLAGHERNRLTRADEEGDADRLPGHEGLHDWGARIAGELLELLCVPCQEGRLRTGPVAGLANRREVELLQVPDVCQPPRWRRRHVALLQILGQGEFVGT